MRIMRRVDRERKYRKAKGECSHVWRTRNLTFAVSGAIREVCERCGVLQVIETDDPAATVALHRGANTLRQQEGTSLGSIG